MRGIWNMVWILVLIGWLILPCYGLLGPKKLYGYKKVLLVIVFGLEGGVFGFFLTFSLLVVLAEWDSAFWWKP